MRNIIELSNTDEIELAANQIATFDKILFKSSGCGITKHGNAPVSINGTGAYRITFHGNVGSSSTGNAILAISVNGTALPETSMAQTIKAATDVRNVTASTIIGKFCKNEGAVTIGIQNIGTIAAVIDNDSVLTIEEV